ncbi:MAG TPA: gluconate 2-dehydrogenase subunit 3 family protein, partial [Parafilimonas sp.]
MDRRKYLKTLGITAVSAGIVADACKTEKKENNNNAKTATTESDNGVDRMPEEKAHEESVRNEPKFFTPEEFSTVTILADIIIPKDEKSGSASD